MSIPSQLLVFQPDTKLSEAIKFAFEREGASVHLAPTQKEFEEAMAKDGTGLVVVGDSTAEKGRALLTKVRSHNPVARVLYLGNGLNRAQALAAGATEFLVPPAFVLDVVTLGSLLCSPHANEKHEFSEGEIVKAKLEEFPSLYCAVRTLAGVQWCGVLRLIRGLRKGEIRFYKGDVTSAKLGRLNGLPAFRHLLLWRSGEFIFRVEKDKPRRQIPLGVRALLDDARRFAAEVDGVIGDVRCDDVFTRVEARIANQDLPSRVKSILRLFDGNRTLADVVEDSAFRLVETLRIVVHLKELGMVKAIATGDEKLSANRRALDLEEWTDPGNGDFSAGSHSWSGVLFSPEFSRMETVSPVIPSASVSGEIKAASVEKTGSVILLESSLSRERLEHITNAEERDKIFSNEGENKKERFQAPRSEAVPKETHQDDATTSEYRAHDESSGVLISSEIYEAETMLLEKFEGSDTGLAVEEAASTRHDTEETLDEPFAGIPEERASPHIGAFVRDAMSAFTEDDEEFFARGSKLEGERTGPIEKFEDLADSNRRATFWQRLVNPAGVARRERAQMRKAAAIETKGGGTKETI